MMARVRAHNNVLGGGGGASEGRRNAAVRNVTDGASSQLRNSGDSQRKRSGRVYGEVIQLLAPSTPPRVT